MVNYLQMGSKVLQDRMEAYGGVTVTYRRPGGVEFTIVAVPGRNPVDMTDLNGIVLRGQVQDFTIRIDPLRAQLPDPKRPLRGDEIIMTLNRRRVVFVVNGEDFSTGHYEPSDSYGVAWRIHTKSDRYLDA